MSFNFRDQTPVRTNLRNDGRAFQEQIKTTVNAYEREGVALLRKIDPPTRVVGGGDARRVLFMTNPFLDFVGVWKANSGRALMIECKSTSTHRLPLNRHGGLTEEQHNTIKAWHNYGAAVAVLWQFSGRVVLLSPDALARAEARNDKSIIFELGRPVASGSGLKIWDFLPVLESTLI